VDWQEIFPQLKEIGDPELKEKVIRVWEEAMKEGGWSEDDLEKIPFTLLVADASMSLVEHTSLVIDISIKVMEVLNKTGIFNLNRDYLIAGACLHDVGKLLEYEKNGEKITVSRSGKLLRHPLSGMGLARKLDLPEEVCHIIAVHSREGEGSFRSPEAIVVHHADFISFETIKSMG